MKELILNYYIIPAIFCLVYLWVLFYVDEKVSKLNVYFSQSDKNMLRLLSIIPVVNCILGGLSIVITLTFLCEEFIKLFKQND